MASTLALRVAARYLQAFGPVGIEFDSPGAMQNYLKEHPNADKSLHTVKKPGGGDAPKGEEKSEHGEGGHGEEKKPKKTWKERLKGLKDSAVNFVKNAPKAVQQFVQDDAFRRTTLMGAHKALTEAPGKLVKKVVDTVKEEVHEYKEAGAGIKAVLKGGKMSDHQKKAFKTVAFHTALGVAAAALTATGVGAAGVFAKGVAKHVAYKAVTRSMGHLAVLEEMGHIGHGVHEIMEHLASADSPEAAMLHRYAEEAQKGKDLDPDEVMGNFITAAVAKELEGFDDAGLEEALNAMSDKGE